MKIILVLLACALIANAANGAVVKEEVNAVQESTSVSYSEEQTESPTSQNDQIEAVEVKPESQIKSVEIKPKTQIKPVEVKPESQIEWKIQLPKNVSAKQQQKIFNKLMPFLAKQFDKLRAKKRIETQSYSGNDLNTKKPDENNDRPFSLEDVREYFTVGEAQISQDDNMATFQIKVTDKIYTELDQKNVRETIWYQKVLEQRNSEWRSGKGKSGSEI